MNLLISGPCGVGKTTISKMLAINIKKTYLSFDEFGLKDMEKRRPKISPFSHAGLDLLVCMQIMLEKIEGEFILEIGGDNIFRSEADNIRYLSDLIEIKRKYSMKVFILVADKNLVYRRFQKTRNTSINHDFENIWLEWKNTIKPFWEKCSDYFLDTSALSEDETCQFIKAKIN